MSDGTRYYMLHTREDADLIPDADLESAIDWFPEGEPMPRDEFFDRLFTRYSGPTCPLEGFDEFELDQMDNDAARRLISRARRLRKEREA